MTKLSSGFAALAVLVLAGLLVSACGVKTHPYPEGATLPGPVRNLVQTQDDQGQLWLTWLSPLDNAAGRPLKSLDHFEVWGADYEKAGFCEGCPVTYQKLAEVYLKPPAPGLDINEGPYQWQTSIRPDRAYRFRVAGFSGRGAVNPASWQEAAVYGQAGPGRLARFSAEAEDLAVRLSFSRPAAGQEIEIWKKAPDRDWFRLDLAGAEGGSLADLQVVYGQTYVYRARLMSQEGQSRVPGPFSREITVRPEDLLPPRPVGFLDASADAGGVRLRWENLSLEEDVAGYRVYRRLEGRTSWTLISPALIEGNTFLDTGLEPGQTAWYQVTAVDRSPAANESRPSPEASVLAAAPEEDVRRPDTYDPGL
ncbi:MAG: fibronectin type III domain-containing protein [Deltaproteobacteria bacterium]|jgi:hypothetical protein|nr:fibronectin type III domain-containing protein [Deltaproteobacteria bacterium]